MEEQENLKMLNHQDFRDGNMIYAYVRTSKHGTEDWMGRVVNDYMDELKEVEIVASSIYDK